MESYAWLAEAFRYPVPGRFEWLEQHSDGLPAASRFLEAIAGLSLGEWEELYTRTWDLNPLTPPYIGFQIWGEDYRRGNFLAQLQAAYRAKGIDPQGELPDHLVPVLQYLELASPPLPELVEVFDPAVEKMKAALKKRDPHNPYLGLFEALPALAPLHAQQAGGRA